MTSQRHMKLTMPGNGRFSSCFNLEENRVARFKNRLLRLDVKAGSHAEIEAMKNLLGRNDLEKAQKEWAAGDHNFKETLLMVAIDYAEERKQENAGKKARLELEANDLKFEVEDLQMRLRKHQAEMKLLETQASHAASELGSEYEKKLERLQAEIRIEMDALLGMEEIQPKSAKLDDAARKKLVDMLSENPENVSLNKISGGLGISVDEDIGRKIMEALDLALGNEPDLPQNQMENMIFGLSPRELVLKNELTVKRHLKNVRSEMERLVVKTHIVARLAMDACPDVFFKKSLAIEGADASWLDDFDAEKAAKADPRHIHDAGKILGSMNGILHENERRMKLQRAELAYVRKTMKENLAGTLERDPETGKKYEPDFMGITDAISTFIDVTERIRMLTAESAALVREYRKNASKYCETARKLAEIKRRAEPLEAEKGKLELYRKISGEIKARKGRMDDLSQFYFQLNKELKKIQEREKKARLHRENSPKEKPEDEEKAKNSFVAPVKIEPTREEIEARKRNLVEREIGHIVKMALDHKKFRDFAAKGNYSFMHKKFIKTMREFAALYYEQGCELGIKQVIDTPIFTNRAKNEGTNARPNSERTLLRLGLDGRIEYRFIIDLSDSSNPVFLFGGIRDDSYVFLGEGKYENEYAAALRDGRGNWFNGLKELKLKKL